MSSTPDISPWPPKTPLMKLYKTFRNLVAYNWNTEESISRASMLFLIFQKLTGRSIHLISLTQGFSSQWAQWTNLNRSSQVCQFSLLSRWLSHLVLIFIVANKWRRGSWNRNCSMSCLAGSQWGLTVSRKSHFPIACIEILVWVPLHPSQMMVHHSWAYPGRFL